MGIRERFIQETLETEGQRMLRNQTTAIESAYVRHSGRLLGERSISVSETALHFEHPAYERFLDIKTKGRSKGLRIHNRFVFGAYSAIARRLMYGFTDEVAERLRETARMNPPA